MSRRKRARPSGGHPANQQKTPRPAPPSLLPLAPPTARPPARSPSPPPSAPPDEPEVRVIRSARRRRTVSARREGGVVVVSIPDNFTREQEREWVAKMTASLRAKEARARPADADLMRRALRLSEEHLGGRARPTTVIWAPNQQKRWGSASAEGSIRLSTRLREVPGWVLDYVLLHELVHLVAPRGHGPEFHALLARYPQADRAEGFLRGFAWAQAIASQSAPDDDVPHLFDDAATAHPDLDDGVPHLPDEDATCPETLF